VCNVIFCCFQLPCVCDTPSVSESCNSSQQHLTFEHDEQKLNRSVQNLFSSLQAACVDGTVPSDTERLLMPKSGHEHTTECVDTSDQEQIDVGFRSADHVQSIIVKLPLIARLQHSKRETPVPYIKTEIVDADNGCCAVDTEDVKPAAAAEVETTDETQADVKKETTAAAKGLQLARETIANIFGTELQPTSMMKIPIKRRAERDADERGDKKQSRTFSRNDDIYERSFDRQRSRYVLEDLHFMIIRFSSVYILANMVLL